MPVQSTFKTKIPEQTAFEPLPPDMYQAIISDVNMEERPDPFDNGAIKQRLSFNLIILDEGFEGKTLKVWTANKWFINEKSGIKSALYALADAVLSGYGTKVDMDFGMEFNPNDLIGKQVRITLTNIDKDGKTYNKIMGYMPIKKELAVPKPEKAAK